MRLLEMLSDRFGAFKALAYSTLTLARAAPDEERPMDVMVAEAALEFADDPSSAADAATEWAAVRNVAP
jgi:hypothetical protein